MNQPCFVGPEPRKWIMDNQGNWILAPYSLWRDEKGFHDRPVELNRTKETTSANASSR